MIQTLRGVSSLPTRSSRSFAPTAPWSASCFTASGFTSYTTQLWPARMSRSTMLAPIRPRPIMPSCIADSPVAVPVASSYPVAARFARNNSATDHAWKGQPDARWGTSPSAVSDTDPTPHSAT